jgi:hypothetical protein
LNAFRSFVVELELMATTGRASTLLSGSGSVALVVMPVGFCVFAGVDAVADALIECHSLDTERFERIVDRRVGGAIGRK